MSPDDFKAAMGSWASGVSVVTARADGLIHGVTVSSFSSMSFAPPLVSVCLSSNSQLLPMVESAKAFAVSVLASDQEAASNHFASRNREPAETLGDQPVIDTIEGQQCLVGAAAQLTCTLRQAFEVGDHTVLIGEVIQAGADSDRQPLVYWRRGYRGLSTTD